MPDAEAAQFPPPLLPETPSLENYRTLFGTFGIGRFLANSLLVSLSSSGQVSPNYWIDPKNGVNYPVAVQTPQRLIDSIEALNNTPIIAPGASASTAQLLTNVADVDRGD